MCHARKNCYSSLCNRPCWPRRSDRDVIAQATKGQLRDVTDEEWRAVTFYISSLMKAKDSGGKAAAKP
jgi:hypothetical protein